MNVTSQRLNEFGETEDLVEATLSDVAYQYGEYHKAARQYTQIAHAARMLDQCGWWEVYRKYRLKKLIVDTVKQIDDENDTTPYFIGVELFGKKYKVRAVGTNDKLCAYLPFRFLSLCDRAYNLSTGEVIKERGLRNLTTQEQGVFRRLPVTSLKKLTQDMQCINRRENASVHE